MNSFKNLLNRVSILTEAKTSPFAGTHPSFGGITKTMSTRGMSSAPYDTVKFLATFLYELNIISDDERKMILKAQGFKGKQLALLEVIKAKSQEIVANSAQIEERMPTELENYINRSTLNRGRDMMADVKGVEGGSGGRRDKYAAQAAALAAKRKASAEAKMQSKALQAAAQGEEADVQAAVDVLVNTLDEYDREIVDRTDIAAGIGFKGAEDVKLDFDDIDINIGATVRDRDTLIDKLVKFFNKQPNYTAEKTRRGVNVEGPTGSFGTNVQDAEDMIVNLIMRARPDIDEAQIVVDLHSDKGVAEDEESYGQEDSEDMESLEMYDVNEDEYDQATGETVEGQAETVFYGDDGEEVDGVVYYTATKNPRTGEIDIQLTGGDVTGYNPSARVDDSYIEYIISNPKYSKDFIADARRDAEYQFSAMSGSKEEDGEDYYDDYGDEDDRRQDYMARARAEVSRNNERLREQGVPPDKLPYGDDYGYDEGAICSVCGSPMRDDEIGDEQPDERVCDYCSSFEDEEYDAEKADIDGGGVQPWEKRLAKRRGFKPVTESYTNMYIVEQARKDSYNTSKKEVSLTFKEKYKPKTSYQLDELRRYWL